MRMHKDAEWNINDNRGTTTWEKVPIAVLMDIRDEAKLIRLELEKMNGLLHCPNFIEIPQRLNRIRVAAEGMRKDAREK